MRDKTLSHPDNHEPTAFTQDKLSWAPWLQPIAEGSLTDRHWAGLVDASRSKSPYFMLLVRDPDILGARTRTDEDIFYNTKDGLPRAIGPAYCGEAHSKQRPQLLKNLVFEHTECWRVHPLG